MTVLEILVLVIAIGIWTLIFSLLFIVFGVLRTLQIIRSILEDVKDATSEMRTAKDQLKNGMISLINILLRRR